MNYLWSDAWLLQAIALAARERRATLAEVIASADAVNHALPTSDELHGGLSRLTAGGFVHEIEDRFDLTNLVPAEIRSRIVESGWQEGRQTANRISRPYYRQDSRRRTGIPTTSQIVMPVTRQRW